MIKINLMPPEQQGKGAGKAARTAGRAASGKVVSGGSSSAPNIVTGLVAVILFGLVAYGGYWVFGVISESNQEVQDLNKKLKSLEATYQNKVGKYEENYRNWELWKDQEEILQVLMPKDRVLWSRKVNMISSAVPPGVFITEIEVQESVRMVETQRSIKRRQDYEARKKRLNEQYENDGQKVQAELGPKPEEVKKPEITQTLSISAVSTGENGNDRFDRMLAFQKALENYEMKGLKGEPHRFMDGFKPEIDFGPMEAEMLDDVAVWSFEFRLATKPMFDSEE